MVKLLYFMKLAERIGCSQEELALPQSVSSMGDLLVWRTAADCSSPSTKNLSTPHHLSRMAMKLPFSPKAAKYA
jgi:hypothetical protein